MRERDRESKSRRVWCVYYIEIQVCVYIVASYGGLGALGIYDLVHVGNYIFETRFFVMRLITV